MLEYIFDLQKEIYEHVALDIASFAEGGGWLALMAVLPMGVVFGAVHSLTPGHSKAVLATYVAGSPIGLLRSLYVSLTLSFTHVTTAILIAVLSLPLVSVALGNVGRSPVLENLSRGLLGGIGLWMLWRSLGHRHRHGHEGEAAGFFAGLIPCPLTLFVMTLAISRGVPEAGIVFAIAMMAGIAFTLSIVALVVASFRVQAARLLQSKPKLVDEFFRFAEGIAGIILVIVALRAIAF